MRYYVLWTKTRDACVYSSSVDISSSDCGTAAVAAHRALVFMARPCATRPCSSLYSPPAGAQRCNMHARMHAYVYIYIIHEVNHIDYATCYTMLYYAIYSITLHYTTLCYVILYYIILYDTNTNINFKTNTNTNTNTNTKYSY